MKRNFCTLFDNNYLFKGVVMLRSLRQNCVAAQAFVLCMDQTCRHILEQLDLPGVTCISLSEVETAELLVAKKNRNGAEYCWTLSACLIAWVMDKYPYIDLITYLDADLMFYSSVEPLFEELGGSSIAIIEHRFTPRLKYLEENGKFCVEWVSFRRDPVGQVCLQRWREQCIEWCYARLQDGRMGDQKYLDEWPTRYSSTHVLQHPGAGLAPWNYPNYEIQCNQSGEIMVEGEPLIFYHFHQFQLLDDSSFDRLSAFYTKEARPPEAIYRRYEEQLKEAMVEVRLLVPGFSGGMKSTTYVSSRRWAHRFIPRRLKEFLKRVVKY